MHKLRFRESINRVSNIFEKGWHSAIDIHQYDEQLTHLLSEAFGGSIFVIFVDTGSETAVANFHARDLRKYETSRCEFF